MIRYSIVCDVCATSEPVRRGLRVHQARAALKALGWRQEPGGRDVCPWCQARAKRMPPLEEDQLA